MCAADQSNIYGIRHTSMAVKATKSKSVFCQRDLTSAGLAGVESRDLYNPSFVRRVHEAS